MPGSNIPMAALGVWILWLGWFGFNGGSELAVASEGSAIAVSQVFLNTNMAASGGVVAALVLSLFMTGKMDVTMAMNGAIAGLVAITADPLSPSGGTAVLVGAIGGVIVYFSILFLEKKGIDDPVGAISAHGVVGIFGVMAVVVTGGASFMSQLIGVVSIALFTFIASFIVVMVINSVMPIRATDEEQDMGLDVSEIGIEAYPEFK
jgi:Amt family ammonium transporter